ncbi:MAG: polysaccharide biosynthesis tyrosine autokinase [Candidatus Promineifilaceae bacterium]|nr:polysaccharide biosynthesis tyrosine autokinase [Candidatus Promineifilaceae bacterium]
MELKRYLGVLRRWIWLIILGAIVAGGAAYFISSNMTPVYAASARYLIDEAPGSNNSNEYSKLLTEQKLAQTYVEIATARPVLEETIIQLGLPFSVNQLREMVSVSAPIDTQILVINAEDTDPVRAADIANTIGEVFITQNQVRESLRYAEPIGNWQSRMDSLKSEIEELESEIADFEETATDEQATALTRLRTQLNETQVRYTEAFNNLNQLQQAQAKESSNIVSIEAAKASSQPIRPNVITNTIIATLIGTLFAVSVIFLVEYLDDTVKSPEQVLADTKLSTLGAIAQIKASELSESIIAFTHPRDPLSEAYRVLRTNLGFSAIDGALRSIVVTSGSPGEGKSTTAANLSIVMAQAGKRVIIVDSDLRRPVQHKILSIGNNRGLTTALLDNETPVTYHLQNTKVKGLRVLTSGPIPPNPAEILSSQRMNHLIQELYDEADVLVFDTPPVLTVTDAAVLSPQVDGTLFVVQVGKTRRDTLVQAVERVLNTNAQPLGVVLNRIKPSHGGYYYYQYYDTYTRKDKRRKKRRHVSSKDQVSMPS